MIWEGKLDERFVTWLTDSATCRIVPGACVQRQLPSGVAQKAGREDKEERIGILT